jgi:hypothetical protein
MEANDATTSDRIAQPGPAPHLDVGRTGKSCPEAGYWYPSNLSPDYCQHFNKGDIFPESEWSKVKWIGPVSQT